MWLQNTRSRGRLPLVQMKLGSLHMEQNASMLQLHRPKRDCNISSVLAPEKILLLLLLSVLMGHLYHLSSSSKALHIKWVGEITTLSKLCEFFHKIVATIWTNLLQASVTRKKVGHVVKLGQNGSKSSMQKPKTRSRRVNFDYSLWMDIIPTILSLSSSMHANTSSSSFAISVMVPTFTKAWMLLSSPCWRNTLERSRTTGYGNMEPLWTKTPFSLFMARPMFAHLHPGISSLPSRRQESGPSIPVSWQKKCLRQVRRHHSRHIYPFHLTIQLWTYLQQCLESL